MTQSPASNRFTCNAIRSLYPYSLHIHLTAFAAAMLEMTILWQELPLRLLLAWTFCQIVILSFCFFVITRICESNQSSQPREFGIVRNLATSSPLKVRSTYRLLLISFLLQALCWGGSVVFVGQSTLLVYAIHTMFLYGVCVLFVTHLAAIPTAAYCFLTLTLSPLLYTLFFKAPAVMTPFAYCLLALTALLVGLVSLRSKVIHVSIHTNFDNQHLIPDLKARLKHCTAAYSETASALSTLNDHNQQLLNDSDQLATEALARNEAIWNAILAITDLAHLQNSWQNCFSGKLASLCQPLETDRIFIVEADKSNSDAASLPKDKFQATLDHSWIFRNPQCIAILKSGTIIHNQSPQISELERELLDKLGIKAFLDIPIVLKNELWGIIGMDRLTTSAPFTTQQINGLKHIANILAMTIRNQQDRSERDRLVTVIEQSSDCILITDPAGQILYANPSCEPITGYAQSEVIGTHIKGLYSEALLDSNIWNQIIMAMKNGEKWQGQFANLRKDHTRYEEEMLVSPAHDHKGGITNQVIIKRNITEKKRLESIVEAANLMDNIGFIFSSIRHELGNPINSIKVSLSVLDSNLESYDKNDIKRFIGRSLTDIGRVEYLLKTLKNFSIFERPIIEKTDVTALLDKFIPLVATELQQKDIQFIANIPQEPLFGMIDPRAFQQVLLNLIANAADALGDTPQKTISLSMLMKENGQLNIIIGDNGCGISSEEQANLFKPFFTTKPHGTGLGLVIVKKMLIKMNCSIHVHSKNKLGTKVLIVIPGP